MNQDDLARRVGITQGYLSEIEVGRKSGDVRTLRKLADALKVTLDSLVPEEPSEQARPRAEKRGASIVTRRYMDKVTPGPRAKKRKAS